MGEKYGSLREKRETDLEEDWRGFLSDCCESSAVPIIVAIFVCWLRSMLVELLPTLFLPLGLLFLFSSPEFTEIDGIDRGLAWGVFRKGETDSEEAKLLENGAEEDDGEAEEPATVLEIIGEFVVIAWAGGVSDSTVMLGIGEFSPKFEPEMAISCVGFIVFSSALICWENK